MYGLQRTRDRPVDRHDRGGAANASCSGQGGGSAPDSVTGVPHSRFLVKMPAAWWAPIMTTRTGEAPHSGLFAEYLVPLTSNPVICIHGHRVVACV